MHVNNIGLYSKKCCGCGLCSQICPKNAISLAENKNGFLYPSVNEELCIDCGLCIKTCQFNKAKEEFGIPSAFLAKNKDQDVRDKSRSGGVFSALSDIVLATGGVVYGCSLTDNFLARHERADCQKDRDRFRGSKYLQSNIVECYKKVKFDLKNGKFVLFSGTPCQVDAVKSYCRDCDEKLFLIDIVCYGTPGNKIWSEYLRYMEYKAGGDVKSINFRDKEHFGWENHIETYIFNNGNTCISDIYAKLFGSNLILRDSCFQCPYKSLNRVGDITLGDAWGINEKHSDFNDDRGVSLILVNSPNGRKLFEKASKELDIISLKTLDGFLQPCLEKNWTKSEIYDEFWMDVERLSFEALIKKYIKSEMVFQIITRGSLLNRFKIKIYNLLHRKL